MKSIKRITLLTTISLLVFSLFIGTTSCKKDEEEETITITETNVVGTWVNTSENITLIIAEENIGTYESDYYSDPAKDISWSITSSNQLDVHDNGLFAQTYQMNDKSTLEDVWGGTILTKQ